MTTPTLEQQARAIIRKTITLTDPGEDTLTTDLLALLQSNGDERERMGRVDERVKTLTRVREQIGEPTQENMEIRQYTAAWLSDAKAELLALTKASEAGQEGEVKL